MKKKLSILCFIFLITLTFAQETNSEQNETIEEFDISSIMAESQNQLLQILDEEEQKNSLLDVIQSDSEIFAEENKEIAERAKREKEEAKPINQIKKKITNKPYTYGLYGVDLFFSTQNFDMDSFTQELNNTLYGLSGQMISGVKFWSVKTGIVFDFDFTALEDDSFLVMTVPISFGFAPIHNDFFVLGLYGTYTFELFGNYLYHGIGGSTVLTLNLGKKWGIFANVDATYRFAENFFNDELPEPNIPSALLKTWKINPSIGISVKM